MYSIEERIVEQQATWIAQRRDARWRMQRTLDPLELWALREIVRNVSIAIEDAFPTDHWWWYKKQQETSDACCP